MGYVRRNLQACVIEQGTLAPKEVLREEIRKYGQEVKLPSWEEFAAEDRLDDATYKKPQHRILPYPDSNLNPIDRSHF